MQADRRIESARQLAGAGQWQQAEGVCRAVLSERGNDEQAAYLLGMIALQTKRWELAAEFVGRAISVNPNVAEYHANLAHALRAMGQIENAGAALERAVALRPEYVLALSNLGALRRGQGRLEEALACYRKAVAIQPGFVPAQMNLGNALKDVGRFDEAAAAFGAALRLNAGNVDARAALAGAVEGRGDVAEAEKLYRQVLAASPGHWLALANLGLLLRKRGELAEGLSLLRRAVLANPKVAETHEKVARGLWDDGFYEEALKHFEEALRIRPSAELRVRVATLIPPVYRSGEEVSLWRKRLVEEVGKLERQGVRVDVTRTAARAPFYLPYAGLEDREVARGIARLYVSPGTPTLPSPGVPGEGKKGKAFPGVPGERKRGKRRVGFISHFFKEHTVGLWTRGMIAQLPRERFEVIVLSSGKHQDAVNQFIRANCDRYIELPGTLPAAWEVIAGLELDVLVYADIGMEGFTYTLAMSRLAPAQCAMWGHPETSGIETVDYYLSSELAEGDGAEAHYTEKLVRFKNLPLYYYRPAPAGAENGSAGASPSRGAGTGGALERGRFGLREDATIYGCLHSTFKLHPEFDAALGEILRRDEKGVILVPQGNVPRWDEIVRERFAAGYGDVIERLKFVPRVSREEFRGLNLMCDVTLAPFPFGAGDTSLEALALGVAVVTMPTAFLRGRFTYAMYRAMGVMDCVAKDVEEYVGIAVGLANDRGRREEVRKKILNANSVLFENPDGVMEMAGFLERC